MNSDKASTQEQRETSVEGEGRPPKGDRPFTWSELRDRAETVEATEEVPEELRALWSDLAVRQERPVRTIEKGLADRREPGLPHRPAWVASVVKPLSAPRSSRLRLQHRGVPVDPLFIWGADDRRIYNDTSYPWGCVCRILTSDGRVGSGVLVGSRHVLTASHVVDWSGAAETIEVHRAGGTVAATARATAVWYFTQITGSPGASTVDEDYAVLVTDQRLGDRFGWMGWRTYDSGWDDEPYWWNIGYPTDVANGLLPVWQRNTSLDEDEFDYGSGRAMTTSADMMRGQSGSPMFGFWSDGPYVVAVASAMGNIFASGDENWCSGGSDLTSLIHQARSGDP
jgi:V8-like Glu-specific endopeptidase